MTTTKKRGIKKGQIKAHTDATKYGSQAGERSDIPPTPCESRFCDQIDYKRCEDTGVHCKAFLIYLQKAQNSTEYKDIEWNASHVGVFKDKRCNSCSSFVKNCELKCENWRV